MKNPIQIIFRDMEPTVRAQSLIERRAGELEHFYDRIMSCRIVIEMPHRRRRLGNLFHVTIDMTVPGSEIVVTHKPSQHSTRRQLEEEKVMKSSEAATSDKHLEVAIRRAFDAARRRLQDYARLERGSVKKHEEGPRGQVTQLFPEEGYGFITARDGREIYFHSNSLLNSEIKELQVGTLVEFVEEKGDKGPQASTVRIVRKPS